MFSLEFHHLNCVKLNSQTTDKRKHQNDVFELNERVIEVELLAVSFNCGVVKTNMIFKLLLFSSHLNKNEKKKEMDDDVNTTAEQTSELKTNKILDR